MKGEVLSEPYRPSIQPKAVTKAFSMLARREVFPHVIEMNYQARQRLGCSVYLVHDANEWMLIDIGFEDTAEEIIDIIRQMDFPLAGCKYLVATHADVDHIQGMKRAKELLPQAITIGHPECQRLLAENDRIVTYAEISAQKISINLPPIKIEETINEGDVLSIGSLKVDVWNTPGHTPSQLSFRLGKLLFSGDNIYRDGCVGNIDAHHGSDLPAFISSLERIRDADVEWLLPSHGPIFRNNRAKLQKTIDRLTEYQHMADFGTCAVDWPLLEEWEDELVKGFDPEKAS
ncbi:MAG TPA: MBL fold metallo-hydrolase [Schlesneria sp.]